MPLIRLFLPHPTPTSSPTAAPTSDPPSSSGATDDHYNEPLSFSALHGSGPSLLSRSWEVESVEFGFGGVFRFVGLRFSGSGFGFKV